MEYNINIECINKCELLEELYKIDDGDSIDIKTNEVRDIISKLPVMVIRMATGRNENNA